MLRKNLISQYKLYSKNLQSVKDKVLNGSCRQVLQNVTSSVERNITKTLNGYCSITYKNLEDNHTQNQYRRRLEDLKECFKSVPAIYNSNKILKRLESERLKRISLYSAVGVTATATTEESLKNVEIPPVPQATSNIIIEPIPEPPPIPETLTESLNQLNALGEPSLTSLGLGGWTPVGFVQNCLEYLHVAFGIPWWEAIVIGTVVVRIFMFPLVIIAQRNAARMNNYLPQLQAIQLKMTEARQCGNQIEAARYSQEMMMFMKEKDLNPLKNMIVPFAQMPVFISFFMGLRKMANLPIESFRDGGLWWFTDLTVPDQYFALPIITSLTLWTTIEIGTDSARLSSQNLQVMKYVLRALPVVILPFTVNFPGAILCYWTASNFISLAQVGFLRIPAVRDYFKIEALIKHDPRNLPVKSKGFVGGIKDSWTNVKLTRDLEERRRYDELQFQRAGKGPIVKTYKYDPTKQVNNPNVINAKKR
ncbi:hypothetical protein ILUMI_06313 [Ignelater luminosus]|uniref:Membrane insertase YidC/Oxa/ALB C-terminal domain-containing protein n=1 Tax=Ignelater luminosus TaxID=2038154 RepID=A0A8K0GCP6_IGNLU|nr:hypothetical protein ILUMI_06313 [Ignelater luminosus]